MSSRRLLGTFSCALAASAALTLGCAANVDPAPGDRDPSSNDGTDGKADDASDGREPIGRRPSAVVRVQLVPRDGVVGRQRVSFGMPLPRGLIDDPRFLRVDHDGKELRAARRVIATYADGSARAVQLQIELDFAGPDEVDVVVGALAATEPLAPVTVERTLRPPDGVEGPRVWAVLPARWLSPSGFAGKIVSERAVEGTLLDPWNRVCDYRLYGIDAFLAASEQPRAWRFDRATVLYRGYARRGELPTLSAAYREAAIYRLAVTDFGVPETDMEFSFAQGLAMHYLATGDDRFRESAEDIALDLADRIEAAGAMERLDELHAGLALLSWVWAMAISDDHGQELGAIADRAVETWLAARDREPTRWSDPDARCFPHVDSSGTTRCTPWKSVVLVEALDHYATERPGPLADEAVRAIVELGRYVAREGNDRDGRPLAIIGVGDAPDEIDWDDEYWGDAAYVVAAGFHHAGRNDRELGFAGYDLVAAYRTIGQAPDLESFNRQCRTGVATPWFLPPIEGYAHE